MERLSLLLNEVTEPQDSVDSHDTQPHESQVLLSAVVHKQSKAFSKFLDLPTILPILRAKSLVTGEEFTQLHARWDRGLRDTVVGLLLELLPRKGPDWALLLYRSLQEEFEHRGHEHLVDLLKKAIEEDSEREVCKLNEFVQWYLWL